MTRNEVAEPTDADLGLDALQSVTHGAVVSVAGVVAQRAVTFVLNLVLTHSLGVGVYGVYAFANRLVRMLVGLAQVGAGPTLLRYVPAAADDADRRNRLLGLALGGSLAASLTFAAALVLLAPHLSALTLDRPAFVAVLRVLALALPFFVLAFLVGAAFRSLKLIEYHVVTIRLALPLSQLCAAAAAVTLGYSVVGVAAALVVAVAAVFAVSLALLLWRTPLRPAATASRREVAEYLNFALPVTAGRLGGLVRSRVDVLLVGALLSASAAGVYNVALFLTGFITLSLFSFNQLLPPVASKLYADGRHDELNALYATVTRWILTAALAVAAVEYVYRRELLGLFGEAFTAGGAVMTLFVAAQLVNCAVGPAGWLLQMTDHQYVSAVNNWVLASLNLGLSYYFVLEFGLVGAAVGTASALAAVNVCRVVEIWYLEGLFPYTAAFWKPLAACAGAVALLFALAGHLSGPTLLAAGAVVNVAAFAGLLALFGVEDRDRRLFRALLAQYRR